MHYNLLFVNQLASRGNGKNLLINKNLDLQLRKKNIGLIIFFGNFQQRLNFNLFFFAGIFKVKCFNLYF